MPDDSGSAPADASPSTETAQPVDSGIDAKAKGTPSPPSPRIKVKTKVDGVEEETELTQEEIQRDYQLYKASNKRFEESSKMRKETEESKKNLRDKTRLGKTLIEAGYTQADLLELSESFIYEHLKHAALTPEQKELMALRQREQQRLETDKQRTERETKEKYETEVSKLRGTVEQEFITALKKSPVPPTPSAVWRMAEKMRIAINHKNPISLDVAAEEVYQDYVKEIRHLAKVLPPEKFSDVVGKEALDILRKYHLAKVQNSFQENRVKRKESQTFFEKKQKGFITETEWRKYMDMKKSLPS